MTLPRDFVPGVVLLLLCAGLYYVTTTFETDPLGLAQGMPATHMPRLVLGLIAGLTVLMMIQGLRAGAGEQKPAPTATVWATVALLGAAAACFEVLGVPLVFAAICATLPALWGARNWPAIIVFAAAIPTAIYIVFRLVLGVRFPVGPLSALGL